MARKALDTNESGAYVGDGGDSNNKKANDNFEALFKTVEVVDLVANNTSRKKFALPDGRTIATIRGKRVTALESALGNITLAIKDEAENTLLVAATLDAKTLTGSFVALSLTATGANLVLTAGEVVTIELVSDNADATGGPVVLEFAYAAG